MKYHIKDSDGSRGLCGKKAYNTDDPPTKNDIICVKCAKKIVEDYNKLVSETTFLAQTLNDLNSLLTTRSHTYTQKFPK